MELEGQERKTDSNVSDYPAERDIDMKNTYQYTQMYRGRETNAKFRRLEGRYKGLIWEGFTDE